MWRYTTGTLANGTHSFDATDIVAGKVSAASAALTVTVDSTEPTVSQSGLGTHTARVWPHGGHGKLIDASALDAIFATPNTAASHQSGSFSSSTMAAGSGDTAISGAVSIAHTELSDNAMARQDLNHHAAGTIGENTIAASGDATHSENYSQASPTQNPDGIHSVASLDMASTEHDIPITSFGHGINLGPLQMAAVEVMRPFLDAHNDLATSAANPPNSDISGLAGAGTDSFVFKPGIGEEPVGGSNNATDIIDALHQLYLNATDIHAALLHAAEASVPIVDTDSASYLITQNLHFHDAHLI